MGKRPFAATLDVAEQRTTASKYGNNIEAWIRGWDFGVEVRAYRDAEGNDVFEISQCGGSHDRSEGRRYLGMVTKEGFESAS